MTSVTASFPTLVALAAQAVVLAGNANNNNANNNASRWRAFA